MLISSITAAHESAPTNTATMPGGQAKRWVFAIIASTHAELAALQAADVAYIGYGVSAQGNCKGLVFLKAKKTANVVKTILGCNRDGVEVKYVPFPLLPFFTFLCLFVLFPQDHAGECL
jgi:hypothetical protein